jgi:hypothetical protein
VSGGEFDDYTRDVLGLASLTVGYALGSIVSIQVRRVEIAHVDLLFGYLWRLHRLWLMAGLGFLPIPC